MRFYTAVYFVLFGIISYKSEVVIASDIAESYKEHEVVPHILSKAPSQYLVLSYNGKNVQFGEELTPTETKDVPNVGWGLDSSSFYTLLMTDPDAPSRKDPKMGEFLHWAIVNIPGSDFSKGETLAEYISPGPPKDTGLHRYILTVFKQLSKLDFDEKPMNNRSFDGRMNFSTKKFLDKYKLSEPIIGNMYQAQYDDYVPVFYSKFEQ